jgi:hypothetical protein
VSLSDKVRQAVEFLNEALKVPGYANDETAKKMMEAVKYVFLFPTSAWNCLDQGPVLLGGQHEVTDDEYRKFKPGRQQKFRQKFVERRQAARCLCEL